MSTITTLTAAPHGGFDINGYQQRLWMLGGVDTPGGLKVHEPTTLYWTIPVATAGAGVPLGSASADWKDPVTGLTNKVQMDADTQDYGVGLATVRNGLIIFRRSSVYLLKGSTSANYTLIPISQEVGCFDPRSIVETDHGVYFMSSRTDADKRDHSDQCPPGSVSRVLAEKHRSTGATDCTAQPGRFIHFSEWMDLLRVDFSGANHGIDRC